MSVWEGGFNPPRGGEPRGICSSIAVGVGRRVSIRPGVVSPGESFGFFFAAPFFFVSIRPGVVSPGESRRLRIDRRGRGCFNPPRGGEPRGMRDAMSNVRQSFRVSIRPGVVSPGESNHAKASRISPTAFQSAPGW